MGGIRAEKAVRVRTMIVFPDHYGRSDLSRGLLSSKEKLISLSGNVDLA